MLTAALSSDSGMTAADWLAGFLKIMCLTTSNISSGALGGKLSSTTGEALTTAEWSLSLTLSGEPSTGMSLSCGYALTIG